MKPIRFHKMFDKHYVKRIKPYDNLTKAYQGRYELFLRGIRGYPLYDHALSGTMAGKRSFSIAGDIRVIYQETAEAIIFLDIGSHSQVYE